MWACCSTSCGRTASLTLGCPLKTLPHPLPEPLSERELEVLRLVAAGLSNQEIADQLFLTVGTIKRHLYNIYSKLGAKSRTDALTRAREYRLL